MHYKTCGSEHAHVMWTAQAFGSGCQASFPAEALQSLVAGKSAQADEKKAMASAAACMRAADQVQLHSAPL